MKNGLHKVAYAQKANANVVRNAEMEISVKNTFFTRKFVSARTCHKFVMRKKRAQKWGYL